MSSEVIAHDDGTREVIITLIPLEKERVDFWLNDNMDLSTSLSIVIDKDGECFLELAVEDGEYRLPIGRDTYELLRRDLGYPRRTEQ